MSIAEVYPETRQLTGEEFFAMGDIGPSELIDGRIVPMSPVGGRHALIESRLIRQLGNFIEETNRGWVTGGEVGIYTQRNPDRVRGADVAVFSHKALPNGLPDGFIEATPEVIVEVVSPFDRWQAVRQKVTEYLQIGVEQVWIVEPDNQSILVHRSHDDVQTIHKDKILQGEGILEGFHLTVESLFK